jgi:hypothetical protein
MLSCDSATEANWIKTLPGRYIGTEKNIREIMILNSDGGFQHLVYLDQAKLLDESGKWKYDIESGMLQVAPFTAFYNVDSAKLMTSGVVRVSDEFAVYRYGKVATKISQSTGFKFSLNKKEKP